MSTKEIKSLVRRVFPGDKLIFHTSVGILECWFEIPGSQSQQSSVPFIKIKFTVDFNSVTKHVKWTSKTPTIRRNSTCCSVSSRSMGACSGRVKEQQRTLEIKALDRRMFVCEEKTRSLVNALAMDGDE